MGVVVVGTGDKGVAVPAPHALKITPVKTNAAITFFILRFV
jgi:hypothetical protein